MVKHKRSVSATCNKFQPKSFDVSKNLEKFQPKNLRLYREPAKFYTARRCITNLAWPDPLLRRALSRTRKSVWPRETTRRQDV